MQIAQDVTVEAAKPKNRVFQRFQKPLSRYARELTLLMGWLGSCLISLNITKSMTSLAPTYLDADWLVSLPYLLQKGSFLGRDSLFTYGPTAQILHWLFILPSRTQNALNGFYLELAGEFWFSLLCFSVIIWSFKKLSWQYIAFLFIMADLSGVSLISVGYRNLLLLLSIILLAHVMNTSRPGRRFLGAILVGWFDVVLQGITFELALYVLAVTFALLLFYAAASRFNFLSNVNLHPPLIYVKILGIVVGSYLVANLLLSLVFSLSSSEYPGLFYYQITSLQITLGYNYAQVGDWVLSWTGTLVLGLIVVFCLIIILKSLPKLSALDNYLFLGLLGATLINLKSITVRSDLGHVITGAAPVLLLFLILGGLAWVKTGERVRLVWVGLLLALILVWPSSNLENIRNLAQLPEGKFSIREAWRTIRDYQLPADKATPAQVLKALDSSTDLTIFPYNNHIALEANRNLFVPVLQTYGATNIASQQSYIEALKRHKNNLEVLYALEGITAGQFNGIQFITLEPVIFEYLYRSFKSTDPSLYSKGYVLLRPAQTDLASQMEAVSLDFKTAVKDQTWTYRLYQSTSCSLLRVTPKISYPIFSILGRPAAFNLTVWAGKQVVSHSVMVSLDPGKTFSTYISLTDWQNFANVFDNQPVQTKKLDAFQVVTHPSGLFQINPSSFELTKFECITFKR